MISAAMRMATSQVPTVHGLQLRFPLSPSAIAENECRCKGGLNLSKGKHNEEASLFDRLILNQAEKTVGKPLYRYRKYGTGHFILKFFWNYLLSVTDVLRLLIF